MGIWKGKTKARASSQIISLSLAAHETETTLRACNLRIQPNGRFSKRPSNIEPLFLCLPIGRTRLGDKLKSTHTAISGEN